MAILIQVISSFKFRLCIEFMSQFIASFHVQISLIQLQRFSDHTFQSALQTSFTINILVSKLSFKIELFNRIFRCNIFINTGISNVLKHKRERIQHRPL